MKEYVSDDEMIAKGNYNETTLRRLAAPLADRHGGQVNGCWKQQSVKAADCLSRWHAMLSTSRRVISLRSWIMTTQELASGENCFSFREGDNG